MKALSFAVCIGAALLAVLCARPRWRVVVHLEPDHYKKEAQAGGIFSQRLLKARWNPGRGWFPVSRDPVDRLRDIPSNFGPPRLYKASRRLLEAHCPVDLDAPDMGGAKAAEDILLTGGVAVRVFGDNVARTGHNVVGCLNETFVAPADVKVDLERHTLHFDRRSASEQTASEPKFFGKRPPPEDMRRVRVSDHFFSNTSAALVTATMHSNALTASLALQCRGAKTWWFLKPDCCNEDGHWVLNSATKGRGFPTDSVFDVITTRPGDVLTFGPFQHHAVLTHAGPTYLRTDRIDAPFTLSLLFRGFRNFGMAFVWPIVYHQTKKRTLGHYGHRCDNAMDDDVRRALLEKLEELDLGVDAPAWE